MRIIFEGGLMQFTENYQNYFTLAETTIIGAFFETQCGIDIVCQSCEIIMKYQPKQRVGGVNFTSLHGPVTL